MKLSIGTVIKKNLDNDRSITLKIINIRLLVGPMPVVTVAMDRTIDGERDTIETVFAQLVEWTNEPGWTVVKQ